MGPIAIIWSAMSGMFGLFIAYVVWEQKKHADHAERLAAMEKAAMESILKTKNECEALVTALKIEQSDKIATIDKKQDVEFAKINTQLAQIMTKLAEIQTEFKQHRVVE